MPEALSYLIKCSSYFTKAENAASAANFANSRSLAASLAIALSFAIDDFRLLITPVTLFVRAATTAFK